MHIYICTVIFVNSIMQTTVFRKATLISEASQYMKYILVYAYVYSILNVYGIVLYVKDIRSLMQSV